MINWKFAALLSDAYKQCHMKMYPKDTTKLVSYFTPRMSRLPDQDFLIVWGVQGFIKEYLIDNFNKNFFELPKEDVIKEYKRILDNTMTNDAYIIENIEKLYDLGYLPIQIRSLREGTKCPIHTPMIEVSNTHPDFAWCVNWIESLLSCSLWYPMVIANAAYRYRQIVNKYFDKTANFDAPRYAAISEFGMRGAESLESGVHASAAFLTSFTKTATIPATKYLEQYYNCDCTRDTVGQGALSTEHSVMCSNYAVDGNEESFYRRLITEIFPKGGISIVSDSYDYWNIVDNVIPKLKEAILNREGCVLIRPDSGDPVAITIETVEKLWNIFSGFENSKGYKVLDSHIRVIYGDSITPKRAEEIYSGLEKKGFAANNVVLGAGSFSMQCLEDKDGNLLPYTRDTFGIAIKATYAEVNGVEVPIFKNPKTDTGHFKKSQKGLCAVFKNLSFTDNLTLEEYTSLDEINQLKVVFLNGKMTEETSLWEVRNELWKGRFYV